MDQARARVVAEELLDGGVRRSLSQEVVIVDERHFDQESVFFYNTRAFLETGDFRDALAGNGPVIVNRATGDARCASSALPWEEQVSTNETGEVEP